MSKLMRKRIWMLAVLLMTALNHSAIKVNAAEADALSVENSTTEENTETITISLAGDCSLGKLSVHGYAGTFYEMYDLYGAVYFFKNVKDIFEADDMTLVNFEGVLTDSNDIVKKEYNIKGKPEFNQILVEADIDAVSFGNNHNMDYGEQGTKDTIAAFEAIDLPYAYDETVGIYETGNGIRIGFVSVNEVYDGKSVEEDLQSGIARLKEENVNIILACCHWGEEGHHYTENYQTELGHKCIDWGADLVVGCHPHVLQGIEQYNGKYIIYSLGNFCFGGNRNPKNKDTMIVQAVFTLTDGVPSEEATLKVIPCTISSVMSRNDYCPTIADEKTGKAIIQKLNTYSKGFGVIIDAEGIVSCAQ